MRRIRTLLGSMAATAALAAGCDTAPPGGGFTNGPPPDLTAEKPAARTDGPDRDRTNPGEIKAAGGESGLPTGGGDRDSGTGGKGGNSGENPPPRSAATTPGPAPKDTTTPTDAAGATKPAGDIKVGTPKSPQ